MRVTAVRGAQINPPVDVVEHPGIPDDRAGHHRREHGADRQAIGTGRSIDVVCGLSTAAAGHVLDDDGRVPWDMFAQRGDHRSYAQVGSAAGVGAGDHGDRLVLIKRRLSERRTATDKQAP